MLIAIAVTSMSNITAQEISDALLFSQDEIQGTARFRALSGAFGALGGDMSAVSINPAGSAIFNRSHASISLSSINVNNDIAFLGNTRSSSDSDIDLHQAGAAFVFANRNEESPWNKFVLSIAYDKTANYDNRWSGAGVNQNSIAEYFLEITRQNEVPFGTLKLLPGEFVEEAYADIGTLNNGFALQQAFLGYWSGIIDPVNLDNDTNDNNLDYVSNVSGSVFNQSYSYASTGYNGKLSFNASTEYDKKLYLGINLNAHFINYERYTAFRESNSNEASIVNNAFLKMLWLQQETGFHFSWEQS